jgi:asparagine synthase (glutamine-hydrolysing)
VCFRGLTAYGCLDSGAQPLVSDDGKTILAVNGEIYNHIALRKGLKNQDAVFKTHSDCEVIMHLVSTSSFAGSQQ